MTAQPSRSGYVSTNGLQLYYEIHGDGQPLVMLHGGLGHSGMLGEIVPRLAARRQVIAVDLHGHGRTADTSRPIRCELMGDDIAALVRHLGMEQVDVMGYSLGGAVALRTTIQHPELVRRLVVVSTPFARHGWYPEIQAAVKGLSGALAEGMRGTPMYQSYAAVAPHPEQFPQLLDKVGEMMSLEYDWSDEVARITAPTLLIFGDHDSVPPAHIARFFELLGGGQKDAGWDGSGMTKARLAILPGLTHYNVFLSPLVAEIVEPFLGGEASVKNWGT